MTSKTTKTKSTESVGGNSGAVLSTAKAPSKPALKHNESGALISGSSSEVLAPEVSIKDTVVVEKVALFSTKNVHWEGVGRISKGYNIVTKNISDKWLQRSHVRLASLEEIQSL